MVWIGLIWLRIGTSGGSSWSRYRTFGFHKMLESSWVAAQLAALQEWLRSVSKWASIIINSRPRLAHSHLPPVVFYTWSRLNRTRYAVNFRCFTFSSL
jgi:hypothetical protein